MIIRKLFLQSHADWYRSQVLKWYSIRYNAVSNWAMNLFQKREWMCKCDSKFLGGNRESWSRSEGKMKQEMYTTKRQYLVISTVHFEVQFPFLNRGIDWNDKATYQGVDQLPTTVHPGLVVMSMPRIMLFIATIYIFQVYHCKFTIV